MKNYTNDEIINKVREIWSEFNVTVSVLENKPDLVKFEIREDDEIPLKAKYLFELCKFFDTQEIDEVKETRDGGYCVTCWYSYDVYVFTVVPTPEEKNERLYDKV